ncbi:hypothetical protein GF386_00660 [Candidatus Pacearchaeota archaeon]|nr:hypothetical protein [Candidatus Pacearchaeota archaeon]MBD3282767.1 hypothetical protein [Candidatus Pacearchaeota archaeon]
MFGKKCPKCNNRIKNNFDFCPHCGRNLKSENDREDYGLIGKNDSFEQLPYSNNSVLDRIFATALKEIPSMLKMIEKQMQKDDRKNPQGIHPRFPNDLDVQFFVNGKKILPQKNSDKKIKKEIPSEKIEKFSKLPKKEPISKIRRLSGKIIYELEVPGVKDIEDILVNQLENSIEIKALSKDKIYHKTLNINLPIIKYQLNRGNLILELAESSQ